MASSIVDYSNSAKHTCTNVCNIFDFKILYKLANHPNSNNSEMPKKYQVYSWNRVICKDKKWAAAAYDDIECSNR